MRVTTKKCERNFQPMTSLKALKCLILPDEKLGFEIMLPHFVLHGITVVSEYTERFNFDT